MSIQKFILSLFPAYYELQEEVRLLEVQKAEYKKHADTAACTVNRYIRECRQKEETVAGLRGTIAELHDVLQEAKANKTNESVMLSSSQILHLMTLVPPQSGIQKELERAYRSRIKKELEGEAK